MITLTILAATAVLCALAAWALVAGGNRKPPPEA